MPSIFSTLKARCAPLTAYISLSLAVLLVGGLAFTGGLGYCLYKSRQQVTLLTDDNVMRIVDEIFSYMEIKLKEAEEGNLSLAWATDHTGGILIANDDTNEEEVFRFLEDALSLHPAASGMAVGFLPSATPLQNGKYGFAAYVTSVSGKMERIRLGALKDYTKGEWFAGTVERNAPFWTHPYKDSSMGKVIVSFCVPMRNTQGECIGVLCLDIDIEKTCRRCCEILPFEHDSVSIVDENYNFIAHSDTTLLLQNADKDTGGLWGEYRARKDEADEVKLETDEALYYFRRIPRTNWTLSVKCSKDEVYAGSRQMERSTTLVAVLSLLFLLLCLIHIFRKLQQITRSKATLDNEIHLAADIQQEMLPDTSSPFLSDARLDLNGYIRPAKDIGGDLYDYFIHDDALYFCIGDVSGKGLSASFFMAATCSLFRNTAFTCDTITSAVESINRSLCVNNKRSMFVTFFVGKLNLSTGHLDYCNAGHNPPVLMSSDSDKTTCRLLESSEGFPLGVLEDSPYPTESIVLQPGDTLFLFTDGVTEAMNSRGEEYGNDRMLSILQANAALPATEITQALLADIHTHVSGAQQSDDLTLLCLKVRA